MIKNKKKPVKVWVLVVALAVVVVGSVLFVGAVAGWFSQPQTPTNIVISEEFVKNDTEAGRKITVDTPKLNELLANKKTFIGISHLPTCTANVMSYIEDYAEQNGLMYVYYPWSQLREMEFHDEIKFAPSVFIVAEGKLIDFLAADSDDDVDKYNDYRVFSDWLDKYLINS